MPKNTQTTAQLHSSQYQYHTSSVAQSWPTLCNPMNHHSTPVLPVHHQLPEFTKTRPLSQWCHPTISSSIVPFSSWPQSFPASESFQMSQLFASGGQSIGVSASTSVLPMNIHGWFPLGWTGWISLQSKRLSRVQVPGSMHETECSGPVHWDDPEGWDGEGGGRGIQDGGCKCTPMTDSCQCMAKTTTTL